GQQVAAGEHGRNRFRLDRRGSVVPALGYGANEGFGQAQGGKGHGTPATSAWSARCAASASACDASRGQTIRGWNFVRQDAGKMRRRDWRRRRRCGIEAATDG